MLPGGQREWITFTDSLSVSFSIKIELNKGRFGYICRIALDDLLPIDFLLSPQGGRPEICATADHLNLISLNEEGDNVEEWKVAITALEGRLDELGSDTPQQMVYVQDYMGQYNSYLQGSNTQIANGNQTLQSLARGQ